MKPRENFPEEGRYFGGIRNIRVATYVSGSRLLPYPVGYATAKIEAGIHENYIYKYYIYKGASPAAEEGPPRS